MKDFGDNEMQARVMGQAINGLSVNMAALLLTPLPHSAGATLSGASLPARGASAAYARRYKRVLDVVLVVLSLPVSLPIILFCALAVWLEGGTPFYRQDRLGQHGKRFSILKLRTMVKNADARLEACLAADPAMRAEWDATQKLKQDPRVTRLGALLRKTSMDELPQLWNVLIGEMSLVGPRPMMPEQLPLYGNASAYFAMKPGITGMWQVSGRNDTRFDYRCDVDATYCATVSFLADFDIIVKTLGVVMRRTGY